MKDEKRCHSRMSLSEVMTIVIAFHGWWVSDFQGILYPPSIATLDSPTQEYFLNRTFARIGAFGIFWSI